MRRARREPARFPRVRNESIALLREVDSDALIARIMAAVTPPTKPLEHEKRAA